MAWNEPGGGNKNPWDRRPQQSGADLDEVVRSWQRRLAQLFGGGRGGRTPSSLNWGAIAIIVLVIWICTGFYVVGAAERGVILRFGKYTATKLQGPHWHLPWPIETREIVNVSHVESIDDRTRMLTSDENLVDIQIAVQYRRVDPVRYLFEVRDPQETLRDVSESAIREVIGQSDLDKVLGAGRQGISDKTRTLIQNTLDSYRTGLVVSSVNLTAVSVPDQVAPAQKDAIKAREDRDRFGQEALAYANEIVPKARGTAARQLQDAQAYKAQVVAEAEGAAARFGQVLDAYLRAPDVTRQRIYIETVENVLKRSRKVVIDTRGGNQVLYIPLDRIFERDAGGDASSLLAPGMNRSTEPPVETVTVEPRNRGER